MFNYHFYEMSLYFPAAKVKIKNLAVGGGKYFPPHPDVTLATSY